MQRRRANLSVARDVVIDDAVATFGSGVGRKLRTGTGSTEDHLRGPFEHLMLALAARHGLSITLIGETRLPDLSLRPDFAVDVNGARVGYVELKKPGHGVPGTWRGPSKHDLGQWEKYRLLPNVLYTDGEQFARYHFGKRSGPVAHLTPSPQRAGSALRVADGAFERTLADFLLWEPEHPRSLSDLVRLTSALCRLLRDDVNAEIAHELHGQATSQIFTELAADWRQVLFPNLSDQQFADQYAQTVAFALLLARVEGVSFTGRSISEIARLLGKKHSLMGRALTVLTDQPEELHSVALTTMIRVLSAVDWSRFPDDSFALLYEDFLAEYDPQLRRRSGVYYTPAELVSFVVRFVDDVLCSRLGRPLGFAERDVIVVDPAMGTGSFLAEVVNRVALTVEREEGEGAVAPQLRELFSRLIGFEKQAAPYAVAELRIHSLLRQRHRADIPVHERRFLADTLDDPDIQLLPLGRMYDVINRSRRGANAVKREEPVMVVIGNPPYAVDGVKGTAPWIEDHGNAITSPTLSAFRRVDSGRLEYVLTNKYIYFWRWATWKAFDAHPAHPAGVVAFVCSAGFTHGPGFAGMREYLRRTADEGWVVDLTPEGHQPPMSSRFFRGNQQPICVAVFIRTGEPNPNEPARVWRTTVHGTVTEKAAKLASLRLDGGEWQQCANGWTEPLHPRADHKWAAMPTTADLLPWVAPGVKPNRTWVYAPRAETLRARWNRLVAAPNEEKAGLLKETTTTAMKSQVSPVPGMAPHIGPLDNEAGPCPEPRLIAHRAFDRKFVIPDARVHHRPSPSLWWTDSPQQIFVTEQHAHPLRGGPALLFSALIPDMHHHSGRGGRVLPLYRDPEALIPNVAPGLLTLLTGRFQRPGRHSEMVTAEDLVAYLAAIAAHSGFTRRFADELQRPGIRIPITSIPQLWKGAVELGREVLWIHSFGERCIDTKAHRPRGTPTLQVDRPKVIVRIPDTVDAMPDLIAYDPEHQTLHVAEGRIAPVSPAVWNYHVSGMPILKHWFGYRKRQPVGKSTSTLDNIRATIWTPDLTTELLAVLNVVGRCVALEPVQMELLDAVLAEPLITVHELADAGILPVPPSSRRIPKCPQQSALFS